MKIVDRVLEISRSAFRLHESAVNQIDSVEIIDFQKILKVPDGLRAHAVANEVDLPAARPAAWDPVAIPESHAAAIWNLDDLPKQSWFVSQLMLMLLFGVFMPIDGSHQIRTIFVLSEPGSPPDFIYSN